MFFAVVVALGIIAIGVKPFVNTFPTEQDGFFAAAVVLGITSSILLIISFFCSKERVNVPREVYHKKDIIKIIFKNDSLVVLAIAMMLNTGVWVTGNAVALYYFKYILNDADLQTTFFMVMLPANVVGAILAPMITKRIGKLRTFKYGSILVGVFSIIRYFVPNDQLTLFMALSVVCSISMMFCSISQWAMLPDTVEYGQWKNGYRSEGLPFAFFSFMQKTGMALAGSGAAYCLSITGYEANTALNAQSEMAIRYLFHIVPGVYSVICLGVLCFYKIDGEFYKNIIGELETRMNER
jgi:Na+/melibiose symporter-like transporter